MGKAGPQTKWERGGAGRSAFPVPQSQTLIRVWGTRFLRRVRSRHPRGGFLAFGTRLNRRLRRGCFLPAVGLAFGARYLRRHLRPPIQEADRRTEVPAQVTRAKGKPDGGQEATPPKSSVEPGAKGKETPARVPGTDSPQKPGAPDTDKRLPPSKERDLDKPAQPVPESPRKQPGSPDTDKRVPPSKERDLGKPAPTVPESPRKQQPGLPDTDKRVPSSKERDLGRPAPTVPESPRKQQPNLPDADKRLQPGKERDLNKPTQPVPERPVPAPAPERKLPGVDRQPGPSGPGGVNPPQQPPQQRPQGPPTGGSQSPREKGGHEKDKDGKDRP